LSTSKQHRTRPRNRGRRFDRHHRRRWSQAGHSHRSRPGTPAHPRRRDARPIRRVHRALRRWQRPSNRTRRTALPQQ
jgi:hypothetical protein